MPTRFKLDENLPRGAEVLLQQVGHDVHCSPSRTDDGTTRRAITCSGTTPFLEGRMAWIILFFAGLAEVVWAVSLKLTNLA